MASDDIMTAGAGGATATVRADIKAAFFDIDGTLTSFVTHVIPQSSIDALHELQDRGVKVFICSGRAPSHMTVVLDMMPVHFDGIIALNGQYCFDDHGLLEKESLLPEDIVTITRWLDEHPDVVANYCEKGLRLLQPDHRRDAGHVAPTRQDRTDREHRRSAREGAEV